jgi:8-oxo-dGTP diphosphatase
MAASCRTNPSENGTSATPSSLPSVDAYPLWMAEHLRVQRVSTYGLARDGAAVLMVRIANFGGGDIGKWMLPGGGLEHGETPEQAVVREVAEETGYRVTVDRLLEVASDHRTLDNGNDFHGIYLVYAVTVRSGEPQAELAGSTDGVGWVEFASLPDLPVLEAFRGILDRWL